MDILPFVNGDSPRRTSTQDPKDAIEHEHATVIYKPRGLFGSIGLMAVHSGSSFTSMMGTITPQSPVAIDAKWTSPCFGNWYRIQKNKLR
jgi:hypothetical protein